MDAIELKKKNLIDALAVFSQAVEDLQKVKAGALNVFGLDSNRLYRTYRDSVIQRFKRAFDLFWKYLKLYLEKNGKLPKLVSPASIFRACHSMRLFDETEATFALEMLDDRNLTSHTYHEKIAETINAKTEGYLHLMQNTLKKIERNAA